MVLDYCSALTVDYCLLSADLEMWIVLPTNEIFEEHFYVSHLHHGIVYSQNYTQMHTHNLARTPLLLLDYTRLPK